MDAEPNATTKRQRSAPAGGGKVYARSRITNGKDVLPGVDGRSLVARRYRDISNQIFIDQGGLGQCSESRQQLIRRFAAAAVLAEQLEAKLALGEQIDIGAHALLCSTLARLATRIGIDRIPRDITPTLVSICDHRPPTAKLWRPTHEAADHAAQSFGG